MQVLSVYQYWSRLFLKTPRVNPCFYFPSLIYKARVQALIGKLWLFQCNMNAHSVSQSVSQPVSQNITPEIVYMNLWYVIPCQDTSLSNRWIRNMLAFCTRFEKFMVLQQNEVIRGLSWVWESDGILVEQLVLFGRLESFGWLLSRLSRLSSKWSECGRVFIRRRMSMGCSKGSFGWGLCRATGEVRWDGTRSNTESTSQFAFDTRNPSLWRSSIG